MSSVLTLVMRESITTRKPAPPSDGPQSIIRDVYDLDDLDLTRYRGLVISAGCDQRFLTEHRRRLTAWVRAGGRLLANGHPMLRYVSGLPEIRTLDFHGIDDLRLHAVGSHPIWDGLSRQDLLLRTGVPGVHSFSDLLEIGVAGFYAHAYLTRLPAGTTTITGIGDGRLPVDISYPLGAGEVIVHAGNDLSGFPIPGSDSVTLADRTLSYLENA
jgi:hypothetical protein